MARNSTTKTTLDIVLDREIAARVKVGRSPELSKTDIRILGNVARGIDTEREGETYFQYKTETGMYVSTPLDPQV